MFSGALIYLFPSLAREGLGVVAIRERKGPGEAHPPPAPPFQGGEFQALEQREKPRARIEIDAAGIAGLHCELVLAPLLGLPQLIDMRGLP